MRGLINRLLLLACCACSAPREVYYTAPAPPYLAYPLPARPHQAVLDSIAHASMRAKAHKI